MEEIVYGFIVGGGATAISVAAKLTYDSWIEYKSKIDSEHNL